ncbi:MAG: rRNA adenine N-6-methyltransferase family protein, partial [Bacteroidota bacterium]
FMNKIAFFKESIKSIKNLKTIGTFTRSSQYVCKEMVSHVNFDEAKVIVELGAGDGVITEHILKNMRPDARLISFEVNELFCKKLRQIDDPRFQVIEDSAERLKEYLNKMNLKEADYVVSAIPFVALPDELGYSIVSTCRDNMKMGGRFIQIHYSLLAKKIYKNVFGNVEVSFVPINIPPAFVLVSEKRADRPK